MMQLQVKILSSTICRYACRLAIYKWDSFWGRALLPLLVSIPMLLITHIGFLSIILPTAIYCKYWATKPNIDPLNLCRLILSLDVAINKCQREVSTLTLFHKSVALQTRTKMQCENNFYGSSVLNEEARSSG